LKIAHEVTSRLTTVPYRPMEEVEWIKLGAMGLLKTDQRDPQTGTTGEIVTGDRMARYYILGAALKLLQMMFDFISVSLAINGCFPVPLERGTFQC
jgi:hypothetical protein